MDTVTDEELHTNTQRCDINTESDETANNHTGPDQNRDQYPNARTG
jgi:hypothetical protein